MDKSGGGGARGGAGGHRIPRDGGGGSRGAGSIYRGVWVTPRKTEGAEQEITDATAAMAAGGG